MDTAKGGRRSRNKVISILVTTSHPITATASTNTATSNSANVGGALTLLCPRSGTIQNSTRIHGGDHHNHGTNAANMMSSSYATKGQVGVSHISFFPNTNHRMGSDASSSPLLLAMAYGSSIDKSADSYGMLVSMRRNNATVPPYVHWKCRLPESNMSGGLLVSPVTLQHVIGGGHSGTLYVWNTFQNGNLIRVIPSVHYRAITCMTWSTNMNHNTNSSKTVNPWNAVLVTAGADGMVHCWSHVDLVESATTSGKLHPIRSWTKHNLPVTSLISIHQGSRIVSSGEDGLIVIMELCSGVTIATIQLPNAIRTLQVNSATADHINNRLFAGSKQGIIYIIDLDTYACHSTIQMGATMIQTPSPQQLHPSTLLSIEDQVFGTVDPAVTDAAAASTSSNLSYQSELRGHDRAITSLAVFHTDDDESSSTSITTSNECLISGDEAGIVRVWDTRRGCCLRVLYPWSSATASGSAASKGSNIHPVTSIHVICDDTNPISLSNENTTATTTTAAMFGTTGTNMDHKRKRMLNFANLIAPLQKFSNDTDDNNSAATTISIPFLQPRNNISSMDYFWDFSNGHEIIRRALQQQSDGWKRPRRTIAENTENATAVQRDDQVQNDIQNSNKADATRNVAISDSTITSATAAVGDNEERASLLSEMERLKEELEMAQAKIVRWELVNNKLMERISSHQK